MQICKSMAIIMALIRAGIKVCPAGRLALQLPNQGHALPEGLTPTWKKVPESCIPNHRF